MISEVCNFDDIRLNAKGKDTHRIVPPPREILQSILAMDGLDPRRFPPLELLASAPLLGSDGKIISRPGYHRRDQIYLEPTIEIPPVPAEPTQQDVDQALNLILVSLSRRLPLRGRRQQVPRAGRHPDPAGSPVGPWANTPSPGSGEYAGNGQNPADGGTVPDNRRSPRRADHAPQL